MRGSRYTHARAQLLWVGSRHVVSDRACFRFSISNAVILAKSLVYFLALVALMLLVSLISRLVACSARIETDTHRRSTVQSSKVHVQKFMLSSGGDYIHTMTK